MANITRINKAEAIFAPLFDMNISNKNEFELIEEGGQDGAFIQEWDSCVIKSMARNFTLRWKGILTLQGYDSIRLFINYTSNISLTGYAVVDGLEHVLFSDIKGTNVPIEPTSKPIIKSGESAVLTELKLCFENAGENSGVQQVVFYWVGLLASEKEVLIESELPAYSEASWNGLINPEGKAGVVHNLFFSEEELRDMKLRVNEPFFKPMLEELKSEAQKWENFDPEREIREYLPAEEHLYRYVRIRDRNRVVLEKPIITLAIAGYLSDNDKWSRMAARMILSVAHTPKWFEGPQCCMSGSTWHHVCFMEDHNISALSIALGYMGDIITPKGIEIILKAIEKAWKWVNHTCEEKGYRWYMNQGIVGNRGRIIGAAILNSYSYGYDEFIERSYQDHTTILYNYLNEEGHCAEGSYYQYSFSNTVLLWLVYSKYRGIDVAQVIPERFMESLKYVESMMSSNEDTGYSLPVNCSRYIPFNMVLLTFISVICKWNIGFDYLYNRMNKAADENETVSGLELMLLLKYLPTLKYPGKRIKHEKLLSFPKSGLLSYDFEEYFKGKLWFICERNPLTGHYHEDRGSIVLEAYGHTLLLDPGTTNYSNLASAYMSRKEYHNTAYPSGIEMKICNPIAKKSAAEAGVGCTTHIVMEDFTYPGPSFDIVSERESGVRFGCDLQPLFGEEVLEGRRDGELALSQDKGSLTLLDKWKFKNKRKLNANFLSNFPWIINKNTVESIVENIYMSIEFTERNGLSFCLKVDDSMIDSNLNKIYTLRIETGAYEEIELCSKIIFKQILT